MSTPRHAGHERLRSTWPGATVRPGVFAAATLALGILAGCAGGATGPGAASVAPTEAVAKPAGGATTHDEFNALLCDSYAAILRAWGNPDTGGHSDLLLDLDAAVAARDATAAAAALEPILAELGRGRDDAARAGEWTPGAEAARAMLDLLAAFDASVRAEAAAAAEGPAAATPAAQRAFEDAGGGRAWYAIFDALRARSPAPGEKSMLCAEAPITLP